jgi:hypothetical protein
LILLGGQQQEEQDRKAARLKEMEARRQAVLQKKAEEEKVKADEEEKKAKEDSERRKKEREENTGKRPLVRTDSKVVFEALDKDGTNGRHVIACRGGQCKEKKGDRRSVKNKAAVEGEKGRTPNTHRKASYKGSHHNKADVCHVAQSNVICQGCPTRQVYYQGDTCANLG